MTVFGVCADLKQQTAGPQAGSFGGWQAGQRLAATFNKGFHVHPMRSFMNTPSSGARETL
jgi:hypothetical protein